MWKYACLGIAMLAACAPSGQNVGVPLDSRTADIGRGVGFGAPDTLRAQRDARDRALAGEIRSEPVISSDELNAAGLPSGGEGLPPVEGVRSAPLDRTGPGAAVPPRTGATSAAPVSVNNPGISDEQSFEAVSARESIESDAERLERQAQAYRVIQPTAVPTRRGAAGPNIVTYALETSNAVGQPVYRRGGIALQSRSARACARYASPDLAQEAFLERGGPERDRLNLDPDGDGFACSWDPAPFRAARG